MLFLHHKHKLTISSFRNLWRQFQCITVIYCGFQTIGKFDSPMISGCFSWLISHTQRYHMIYTQNNFIMSQTKFIHSKTRNKISISYNGLSIKFIHVAVTDFRVDQILAKTGPVVWIGIWVFILNYRSGYCCIRIYACSGYLNWLVSLYIVYLEPSQITSP